MQEITPIELEQWQRSQRHFTLLDVRRAHVRAADGAAIAGSEWRSPDGLFTWKDEIAADRPVVVVCAHGHELSQGAAATLSAMGLDARFLVGGFAGWRDSGRRVVSFAPISASEVSASAGPSPDQRGGMTRPVLLLTRRDVAALMVPSTAFGAVEQGFAALGAGLAQLPPPLHLAAAAGGFHAKAAAYRAERHWVALKFNANFPGNPARHGLPTVQGAILLFDGDDGRPLAVIDSIELTLRRTAAATALAARHLARAQSAVLALCGCGAQALALVEALVEVLPLRHVLLWDIDKKAAERLRERLITRSEPLEVRVAASLADATRAADAVVTCTPSRQPFLDRDLVRPGCFIAAIGADNPEKSEITPGLMAASTVVVDSRAQCAAMGDLRHAIAAGAMRADQVHADLAELVLGTKAGRTGDDEIWLFDSTGVAIQDVACAALVFERAVALGIGAPIDLSGD